MIRVLVWDERNLVPAYSYTIQGSHVSDVSCILDPFEWHVPQYPLLKVIPAIKEHEVRYHQPYEGES